MIIRRIGFEDVEAFKSIRLEALQLEPEAYASRYEDWINLDTADWHSRMNGVLVMAFDGDVPVGLMAAIPERPSGMAHRALVVMVYVRQSYRGRDVSAKLLDQLVRDAVTADVLQLELMVNCHNTRAIRFYERHGFERLAVIPRAVRVEKGFVDDLLMMRRLDA